MDETKAIAFNGSPRKNGNTNAALKVVLDEIEKEGIKVELVQMGSANLKGCTACGACLRIGCPAISLDAGSGKPRINPATCAGCGLCTTVCPSGALTL